MRGKRKYKKEHNNNGDKIVSEKLTLTESEIGKLRYTSIRSVDYFADAWEF